MRQARRREGLCSPVCRRPAQSRAEQRGIKGRTDDQGVHQGGHYRPDGGYHRTLAKGDAGGEPTGYTGYYGFVFADTESLRSQRMDKDNRKRFLIDGFPRQMDQAIKFDETVRKMLSRINAICSPKLTYSSLASLYRSALDQQFSS